MVNNKLKLSQLVTQSAGDRIGDWDSLESGEYFKSLINTEHLPALHERETPASHKLDVISCFGTPRMRFIKEAEETFRSFTHVQG